MYVHIVEPIANMIYSNKGQPLHELHTCNVSSNSNRVTGPLLAGNCAVDNCSAAWALPISKGGLRLGMWSAFAVIDVASLPTKSKIYLYLKDKRKKACKFCTFSLHLVTASNL